MKRTQVWILAVALLLLLALAFPARALAAPPGLLIIGNSYTLESGESLDEDLAIIGGNVTIEEGATVYGNILMLGGTLQVDGKIEGDITAAGGVLELGESAQVDGDVSTAGAALSQAEGAQIEGKVTTETTDTLSKASPTGWRRPFLINQVVSPLAFLARVLVVGALAALVMMFFPRPVERVAQALISQPVLSGGMGIVTLLVFPLALVLALITIILIPIGLLSILGLALLYLFGWIAFGYEVGRRFAEMFHWDWAPPVHAGVGTLITSLVFGSLGQIPCLGWLISFVVWNVALGAVLLTRFGTQPYADRGFPTTHNPTLPPAAPPAPPAPSASVAQPVPPAPPAPAEPPAPPAPLSPEGEEPPKQQ